MLTLDDGLELTVDGRPAQGTRHTVLRAKERRSGDRVVVKIEAIPDALAVERLALEWVRAHGGGVPTLRAASTVVLPDGRRAACLVMDHVDGRAPHTNAGWQRMGRTLAALTALPWTGCGLPIYDATSFADAHQRRLRDLGTPLREAMADIGDWERLSERQPSGLDPLVLTHGDPGPGNFLDVGHTGTLIDGPTELRWWLTVAGIQFAHRRRQRAGQPGVLPWTDAIAVLVRALRDDRPWTPG